VGKGELAAVRARSFLVSLVVLIQASWSSPSWGWVLEGHHSITLDALAVLPPAMREALTPHVSVLLAGVVEPDFHRVVSHKIPIISLSGTPPPARSGAANEFQRLATNAQEMLRLGRDLSEVSFVLGQATHFVQDLNQPLHAAWGETRAEHNEVEAQMLYRSWQKEHTYRGFMLVRNYSCFALEIAQNSSQHARPLFFDREIKRVTEIAWDQAVNDTANLWQSILWHALGRERAWQQHGIPAPVREIANGSLC
jgi:Zinc dependent phospholipase C